MNQPTVHVFPEPAAVSDSLALEFLRCVRETPAARPFRVALAGGQAAVTLYRVLAGRYGSEVPWARVNFFWSDERLVPLDDPASNHAAARRCLLVRLPSLNATGGSWASRTVRSRRRGASL